MINISLAKEIRCLYQPKRADFIKWVKASLTKSYNQVNLGITIVTEERSQKLNKEYRGKNYPTNVISLEYASTRSEFNFLYGELILCDEVILQEAVKSGKNVREHYAQMVVHGVLHLQGMDHQNDLDAVEMEQSEIIILKQLGFSSPY